MGQIVILFPKAWLMMQPVSFGITILPRSSARRTIPVAFIAIPLLAVSFLAESFAGNAGLCSKTQDLEDIHVSCDIIIDFIRIYGTITLAYYFRKVTIQSYPKFLI